MTQRRDPQLAPPTRRRVLTGLAAGAASLAATRVFAQGGEDPLQQLIQQNERGDFGQGFDRRRAPSRCRRPRCRRCRPATAQTTEAGDRPLRADRRARRLAESRRPTGCGSASAIRAWCLRARLTLAGDLDPGRRRRHLRFLRRGRGAPLPGAPWPTADGIARDDDVARRSTCRPTERLNQLKTNLVRLRTFSATPAQRYVVCNIPAAQHRGDRERRGGVAPCRGRRQAGPRPRPTSTARSSRSTSIRTGRCRPRSSART